MTGSPKLDEALRIATWIVLGALVVMGGVTMFSLTKGEQWAAQSRDAINAAHR